MKFVQIIEENIPEVEAIDLSDNRISTLEQFASLFSKVTSLKILYLANNKVRIQFYLSFDLIRWQ